LKRKIYIPIAVKFWICLGFAAVWMALSIWLSQPWLHDLGQLTHPWLAAYLIGFIAIFPGFINAFVLMALLVDQRPRIRPVTAYPDITLLVAAYNEAGSIAETVHSVFTQDYPGRMHVFVINDGSRDATADQVRALLPLYPDLRLIDMPRNQGKSHALNKGLQECTTDLVLTLDADCLVWHDGLKNIVGRYLSDPPETRAVAGLVLIRNSRDNWITRTQEWDYFLGIAATKRVQSLFQGTLVSQGAFSVYDRATVAALGGWPHVVGEDIVLTWRILAQGHRVGYAENAAVFTRCPDTVKGFVRQRQRWSRGMIEAFKATPGLLVKPRLTLLYIWWNLMFPFMDLAYTVGFLPGLVLAMFGYYWLVGPMTLALLPLSAVFTWVMYRAAKKSFDELGLKVRRNPSGFVIYSLAYTLILQPACVWGYAVELLGLRKTWGTK
jgi:biofilm PGA synthesis N-glycosyltransferase PgaC